MVGLATVNAHDETVLTSSFFVGQDFAPDRTSPMTRRAEQRLRESPFGAIRHVRCRLKEQDGAVELIGCVPDFYSKQLAQETIRSLPGLRAIHNHLSVVSSTTHRAS